MDTPLIFWFRNDLRLLDNPALRHTIASDNPIFFIYIYDESVKHWAPGAASRWWLHHSLQALQNELAKLNVKLHFFKGEARDVLTNVTKQLSSKQIVCSRLYEPANIKQDAILKKYLAQLDIDIQMTQGNVLFNPGTIRNKQNNVYKVFTPFYKTCLSIGISSEIIDKPKNIKSIESSTPSLSLTDLDLLPKVNWDYSLQKRWVPGEVAANNTLNTFIQSFLLDYSHKRDFPNVDATSHLSAHLHFGEIAPQRIIYQLTKAKHESVRIEQEADNVIRQLVWREFAYHMLVSFPKTCDEPFQEKFKHFPWKSSDKKLETAWKKGLTGYPIIDAGMRELWHTGYMHNRVRMIVASFLTKNGLLHWKKGAEWFWDTLVDADLAQNTMNWQWVAGCGVDAAPYFRIFNPVTQSKKFDADGIYIRRWCPELKGLPDKFIHAPWTAPVEILKQADVTLGRNYPKPVLDLEATRERALSLYKSL